MTTIDYNAWATTYDDTRGVSPSVLAPLLDALGPSAGRSLLEIGCGTGNYAQALAQAGFRVTPTDPTPEMVRRALAKLPDAPAAIVDAQALPYRGGSFDCAVAIKVINHVPRWQLMLTEARRVIRDGPFVMVHATKETIQANWITHYAPSLLNERRFLPEAETAEALRSAGFRSVDVHHVLYTDMADGSAQALKRFPEAFLEDEAIMNTSLFRNLIGSDVQRVLTAVRRDYHSGRLKEIIAKYEGLAGQHGDGTVFVAP